MMATLGVCDCLVAGDLGVLGCTFSIGFTILLLESALIRTGLCLHVFAQCRMGDSLSVNRFYDPEQCLPIELDRLLRILHNPLAIGVKIRTRSTPRDCPASTYTRRMKRAPPGKLTLQLTSDQASIPIQARTGHCRLNQHLFGAGVVDNAKYGYGSDGETIKHVFLMCLG